MEYGEIKDFLTGESQLSSINGGFPTFCNSICGSSMRKYAEIFFNPTNKAEFGHICELVNLFWPAQLDPIDFTKPILATGHFSLLENFRNRAVIN